MHALTQENFIRSMRMGPLRVVVSGICLFLMLFESTGMRAACMSGLLFLNKITEAGVGPEQRVTDMVYNANGDLRRTVSPPFDLHTRWVIEECDLWRLHQKMR